MLRSGMIVVFVAAMAAGTCPSGGAVCSACGDGAKVAELVLLLSSDAFGLKATCVELA